MACDQGDLAHAPDLVIAQYVPAVARSDHLGNEVSRWPATPAVDFNGEHLVHLLHGRLDGVDRLCRRLDGDGIDCQRPGLQFREILLWYAENIHDDATRDGACDLIDEFDFA